MPVAKSGPKIGSGLLAMANVVDGYLAGEQVSRDRFVEERDYKFRRDVFDEQTRQFDVSFEEQVRQFDTQLSFSAEQAALDRSLNRETREDFQRFTTTERESTQVFQSEETALERQSREEHQQRQRALEYHRIKKQVEMDNLDRELRWSGDRLLNFRTVLGDYDKFDDMPDNQIVGRDKNVYSPKEIDLRNELENIVKGKGSLVLEMLPEHAQGYLDQYGQVDGGLDVLMGQWLSDPEQAPLTGFQPTDKAAILEQLAIQHSEAGGDPKAWAEMSAAQKKQILDAVAHDLNNLDLAQKRQDNRELNLARQRQEIATGSDEGSVYPYQAVAQANGQYFYYDGGKLFSSGLGNPMIGQAMTQSTIAMADYYQFTQSEAASDEDLAAAKLKEVQDQLRDDENIASKYIIADGGDPRQARQVFDAYRGSLEGKIIDYKKFPVGLKPIETNRDSLGTIDGGTKAGTGVIKIPSGIFRPGDTGYELAQQIQAQQAQNTDLADQTALAASNTQVEEDLIKALQTAQAEKNVQQNILQFQKASNRSMREIELFTEVAKQHPGESYNDIVRRYIAVGKSQYSGNLGIELLNRAIE